jgi:hypothetical protein
MFLKVASIYEVSKKIASAVDESLSNQQKEFFLRQQMAAIQRELHALQRSNAGPGAESGRKVGWSANNGAGNELNNDDEQNEADDLAELKRKIEAMELNSEERKMGVREWRRLKRIPAGSVENGVIRTYVRISELGFVHIPGFIDYVRAYSLIGSHLFHGQTRHCLLRLVMFPRFTSQNPLLPPAPNSTRTTLGWKK